MMVSSGLLGPTQIKFIQPLIPEFWHGPSNLHQSASPKCLITNSTLFQPSVSGECGSLENVYKASMVSMMAGSDFIKTSTGKEGVNAILPVALVMVRCIRDYHEVCFLLRPRKFDFLLRVSPSPDFRALSSA